ncbi:MAG: ATP-binding protein [Armatimonadetes bacterium]|nr:ATP-binding protein [Armatimonadota bacterium]
MIESIRAVGYTVQTAIADLVDNSIAASAKNVWVTFHWHGVCSYVSVADDGCGMTESKLTEAMRLGSQSPLDAREPHDLGRFGLGLKTASFSQCRQLSVWSKASGRSPVARCWDLDYVQQTGDWRLLKGIGDTPAGSLAFLESWNAPGLTEAPYLGFFESQKEGVCVHESFQVFLRVPRAGSAPGSGIRTSSERCRA